MYIALVMCPSISISWHSLHYIVASSWNLLPQCSQNTTAMPSSPWHKWTWIFSKYCHNDTSGFRATQSMFMCMDIYILTCISILCFMLISFYTKYQQKMFVTIQLTHLLLFSYPTLYLPLILTSLLL